MSFLQALLALHSRPVGHCLEATVGSQSSTRAFAAWMDDDLVLQKSTQVPTAVHASMPVLALQLQRTTGAAMEQIGVLDVQSLSDWQLPASRPAWLTGCVQSRRCS